MKYIVPILLAASLAVLIFVSQRSIHHDARVQEQSRTPEKTIVAVGEKGLLHSLDHRDYVIVFSSPLAYAASVRAESIGDSYGQSRLIGRSAFDTPEGTRVLVIDQGVNKQGLAMDEVRLLDGPHAGEAVWVGVPLVEGI